MTYLGKLNEYLSGKELFIWFTVRVVRKLLSMYIFSYFPFDFEGRVWDLIVSVTDRCLSFYFTLLMTLFTYVSNLHI